MSLTLTARLRAETAALHTRAERTTYMSALMGSTLDRPAYCLMLRNLEPAYTAMEAGLTLNATHAAVAPIHEPALFRSGPLRLDLQALHGPSWAHDVPLAASTGAWVRRLQDMAAHRPELLAAHAYVRYLGDLSGGQMLRKLVSRSLGLPPGGSGVAFYDFGPAESVAALAQALRAGLNQVAPGPAAQDAVVAEAIWAFEMHCSLFDELALAAGVPLRG